MSRRAPIIATFLKSQQRKRGELATLIAILALGTIILGAVAGNQVLKKRFEAPLAKEHVFEELQTPSISPTIDTCVTPGETQFIKLERTSLNESSDNLFIEWEPVPDATYYKVGFSDNNGSSWRTIDAPKRTTKTLIIPHTQHAKFRIHAVRNCPASANFVVREGADIISEPIVPLQQVQANILPCKAPEAQIIFPKPDQTIIPGLQRIAWTAANDVQAYMLSIQDLSDPSLHKTHTTKQGPRFHYFTFINGHRYTITLTVENTCGQTDTQTIMLQASM